jgi:hypothetical protein
MEANVREVRRSAGERRARARIQELFHGLIRSRCREGEIAVPDALPSLSRLALRKQRYFAVPGMYGGFSYELQEHDGTLSLVAESWCRIADGSERRHVVTEEQVLLTEEGCVQS